MNTARIDHTQNTGATVTGGRGQEMLATISWLTYAHRRRAVRSVRMQEFEAITSKYTPDYIDQGFQNLVTLNDLATVFYKDVAELYELFASLRNRERDPDGFSLDDAPVLGLIVRIAKMTREVIVQYEKDQGEIISLIERPILEAAATAIFLMKSGPEVMLDYRKCSFKDRLRILRDFSEGTKFFDTKPGQRIYRSVLDKLAAEGFTPNDFDVQKKNRWKLQGRSFQSIFAEVFDQDMYAGSYGMMSGAIHGSWNESMDWSLARMDSGHYRANLNHYPSDVRFITPMLAFTNPAMQMWLHRIDCYDENVQQVLAWIERVNMRLFHFFDAHFDE